MTGKVFFFSSVFILLIFSSAYGDEKISIQPSIPSSVKPGTEFTVELTINKGSLSGAASLKQFLPEGFTATALETNHAEFVFGKNQGTFSWKELPKEKSFTVSYKVKTDVTCNGLKTVNGELIFVEKDKAKKIPQTPSVVILYDEIPVTNTIPETQNMEIIVDKHVSPFPSKTGEYKVELKIRKGTKQNAIRVFDPVIDGYRAELIDAHGARFSIANKLAEFYWEIFPVDSVFLVSYRLAPDSMARLDYSNSDLMGSEGSGTEENLFACMPDRVYKNNEPEEEKNTAEASTQPAYSSILAPQQGIYYKVQIAATRRSPQRNNEFFRSKFSIRKPVDLTMQEGWRKYMIGTFENYTDAKKLRAETLSKIPDAFVVAYDNDVRIPLREAMKTKKRNP